MITRRSTDRIIHLRCVLVVNATQSAEPFQPSLKYERQTGMLIDGHLRSDNDVKRRRARRCGAAAARMQIHIDETDRTRAGTLVRKPFRGRVESRRQEKRAALARRGWRRRFRSPRRALPVLALSRNPTQRRGLQTQRRSLTLSLSLDEVQPTPRLLRAAPPSAARRFRCAFG